MATKNGNPSRKAVALSNSQVGLSHMLVVLADDGTLWRYVDEGGGWVELAGLPQPEPDAVEEAASTMPA